MDEGVENKDDFFFFFFFFDVLKDVMFEVSE